MYMVVKRDGTQSAFNVAKISAAITKAFEAQKRLYHPTLLSGNGFVRKGLLR